MRKLLLVFLKLATVLGAALVLMAQAEHITSFTGAWKLNLSKSSFDPGPPFQSFTITFTPDGTRNLDLVGADGRSLKAALPWSDGKEVAVRATEWMENATAVSKIQGNVFDDTWRQNGKVIEKVHGAVAPDGRTLTIEINGMNGQERTFHNRLTFEKLAAQNASVQKQRQDGFDVVGFEVRTNNAREASGGGLIRKQWERLYRDGGLSKISHRSDSAVIALYSGYASDEHGDYDYLLGGRVNSCDNVPDGMVCRRVPAADYVVLESERGTIPGIVVALWQRVWGSTPEELGGARSFRYDYEVYDSRAADQAHAQIELNLGIK